jgi:hypothetical protein
MARPEGGVSWREESGRWIGVIMHRILDVRSWQEVDPSRVA